MLLYDGGAKEFSVEAIDGKVVATDPAAGSVLVAVDRPFTSTVVLGWMMPVEAGGLVSVTPAMVAALCRALGMKIEVGGVTFAAEVHDGE